jgi:hypothetical protein
MRVPERRACSSTVGCETHPQEDSAAEAPVIREELVASRHPMRPEGDRAAGPRWTCPPRSTRHAHAVPAVIDEHLVLLMVEIRAKRGRCTATQLSCPLAAR